MIDINIKIYSQYEDDLPHFFIRCSKVREFWLHLFNFFFLYPAIVFRSFSLTKINVFVMNYHVAYDYEYLMECNRSSDWLQVEQDVVV